MFLSVSIFVVDFLFFTLELHNIYKITFSAFLLDEDSHMKMGKLSHAV